MSDDKKKKIWDKIIMGAVIGGAIGSVLGASVAPKKGEETRKEISDAFKKAAKASIPLLYKVKSFLKRQKKIPNEMDQDKK